jgi:hypothetical protein
MSFAQVERMPVLSDNTEQTRKVAKLAIKAANGKQERT